MKNSSRHNPTNTPAALTAHKQQWLINSAGAYGPLQLKSPLEAMLRHGELLDVQHAGIRASTHMKIKPIETVPLRAAQGDDDIMSQEKTL